MSDHRLFCACDESIFIFLKVRMGI